MMLHHAEISARTATDAHKCPDVNAMDSILIAPDAHDAPDANAELTALIAPAPALTTASSSTAPDFALNDPAFASMTAAPDPKKTPALATPATELPALATPAPELPALATPAPELPALDTPAPVLPAPALIAAAYVLTAPAFAPVPAWTIAAPTLTSAPALASTSAPTPAPAPEIVPNAAADESALTVPECPHCP